MHLCSCIRVDSIESTPIATFSSHPKTPVVLHILSLAQIDFRYDESTARETIRHDSTESNRIDNISTHTLSQVALNILSFAQIDFRYHETTTRRTRRMDSIKQGSRIDFRLVESSVSETNRLYLGVLDNPCLFGQYPAPAFCLL